MLLKNSQEKSVAGVCEWQESGAGEIEGRGSAELTGSCVLVLK